jgi:anti-sigma B factor antagonist
MEIVESRSDGFLVLAFKGRLDANTANAAQEKVLLLIDGGETRLVADLAELVYLSSAGLRVFMIAAKRIQGVRGKIALCSLPETIQEIFDIAGLSALFPIYPGRDEAIASLR